MRPGAKGNIGKTTFCYLLLLISSLLNTRQAQERIFNQNRSLALFSLNCLSFIDEGESLSSSFQHLRLTSSSARYECFINLIQDYLPKVHFWLTKKVYWRNWPKHSSLSNTNAKKGIPWISEKMLKNDFHFSFKAFVLLIESVLQPICFFFINQQHMHFVGTKKGVIQSTSATEGITSY